MKFNKWTVGLAAVGVVSFASAVRADEPAATTSTVLTSLSSTTLSGYVDVSGIYSVGGQAPGGVTPAYTPAIGAGSAGQGINLDVVDIALDKPLDESQWAAGYHVELWMGPDANGLNSGSSPTTQDFGIRQAYVALRTPIGNGINWKLGVFDTIIGYEGLTSYANPNFTHSYGFAIEPTTHTGILGSYQFCDAVNFQGGVADTTYSFGNTAKINNGMGNPTVLGLLTLTAPDSFGWAKGASLYLGGINTGNSAPGGGGTSWYVGLTLPTPSSAVKVGASFDYLDEHKSADLVDLAGYLTFQATEKLALNLRAEYFRDNGAVTDPVIVSGGAAVIPTLTELEAEEVTFTASYDLWKNVVTRAEFRVDHLDTAGFQNNTDLGSRK